MCTGPWQFRLNEYGILCGFKTSTELWNGADTDVRGKKLGHRPLSTFGQIGEDCTVRSHIVVPRLTDGEAKTGISMHAAPNVRDLAALFRLGGLD